MSYEVSFVNILKKWSCYKKIWTLSITCPQGRFIYRIRIEWVLWSILLTHWGQVMHIYVSKLSIIGSDNGLLPGRCQAMIWTHAGILLIGPLGTNIIEISIAIWTFSLASCLWTWHNIMHLFSPKHQMEMLSRYWEWICRQSLSFMIGVSTPNLYSRELHHVSAVPCQCSRLYVVTWKVGTNLPMNLLALMACM